MAAARRCSECGTALPENAYRTRKTCSDTCRSGRSRRLKAARHQRQTQSELDREVGDLMGAEGRDAALEVAKEELRPIVREALTEDVLRGLQNLVGLTPRAVVLLTADLEHPEPQVRQKAYALVMRYGLGNRDITGSTKDAAVEINLTGIPRPDSSAEAPMPVVASDAVELRQCEQCLKEKPISEYEGEAPRCKECQDSLRRQVMERFSGDD